MSAAGEFAGSAAATETESGHGWRENWYPVAFVRDVEADVPYAFLLMGEPLVLFLGGGGQWFCGPDRCPHRAARLSEGRLQNGRIECLYHGWQFDGAGQCQAIPQWPRDQPLPSAACLERFPLAIRQGMFWVWPGQPDLADAEQIPTVPALDAPETVSVDYLIDLPYGQSFLVENVIDVAHIHIAHDGIRGGGHRELAAPLAFDVVDSSERGIQATFRSLGSAAAASGEAPAGTAHVEYVAPNLVWYTSAYADSSRIAGLALYSIPLDTDRCRLLYRKYSNFYSSAELRRPRWREHWIQNEILRQDMSLIIGQHDAIRRQSGELEDRWLPLKTSDTLVIHYRKWLDQYAADRPDHRGFSSHRQLPLVSAASDLRDVYSMHTRHCRDCLRMHGLAGRLRAVWVLAMLLAVPVMALGGPTIRVVGLTGYLLAAFAWWVSARFRRRFERSS